MSDYREIIKPEGVISLPPFALGAATVIAVLVIISLFSSEAIEEVVERDLVDRDLDRNRFPRPPVIPPFNQEGPLVAAAPMIPVVNRQSTPCPQNNSGSSVPFVQRGAVVGLENPPLKQVLWQNNATPRELPFQEAHWQGLEVIPLTPALAKSLGIVTSLRGVVVDDVTTPADIAGFQAGDVVTEVGQVLVTSLETFIEATDRVRKRRRVELRVTREGARQIIVLTALRRRLGIANGETAPMIRAGSRRPHRYLGPCTQCHRIGNTGQLAVDQGDVLSKAAPTIHSGAVPPHRERGACSSCHEVVR